MQLLMQTLTFVFVVILRVSLQQNKN